MSIIVNYKQLPISAEVCSSRHRERRWRLRGAWKSPSPLWPSRGRTCVNFLKFWQQSPAFWRVLSEKYTLDNGCMTCRCVMCSDIYGWVIYDFSRSLTVPVSNLFTDSGQIMPSQPDAIGSWKYISVHSDNNSKINSISNYDYIKPWQFAQSHNEWSWQNFKPACNRREMNCSHWCQATVIWLDGI